MAADLMAIGVLKDMLMGSLWFLLKRYLFTVFFFPRILVGTHRDPERPTPSLQAEEKERQNKLLKY